MQVQTLTLSINFEKIIVLFSFLYCLFIIFFVYWHDFTYMRPKKRKCSLFALLFWPLILFVSCSDYYWK